MEAPGFVPSTLSIGLRLIDTLTHTDTMARSSTIFEDEKLLIFIYQSQRDSNLRPTGNAQIEV